MPARKTVRRKVAGKARRKNPAVDAAQYRLAQAVLHGTAKTKTSMTKKAAQELIAKTPAAKRSQFMKGNPHRKRTKVIKNIFGLSKKEKAYKAGQAAGNASARAGGRSMWSQKDMAAARKAASKVWPQKKRNPGFFKKNPEESATAAYREFHGKEPEVDIIIDTPIHFHKVLAGMARLVFFDVKRAADGGTTTIRFDRKTYLTESEKKDQLFISGGDQSVNLRDFGITAPHEFEVLGTILKVGYYTEKKHLIEKDGGKGIYVHPFKAPRPTLIYDVRSKRLTVAGGGYTIPSEGIDG